MQKDRSPFLTKQDFDKPLAWIYFKNNQPKIGVYRNPPYFTQTSYSSWIIILIKFPMAIESKNKFPKFSINLNNIKE